MKTLAYNENEKKDGEKKQLPTQDEKERKV